MDNQEKEPGMAKFNRVLWYIMGVMTLIIFLIVTFVIVRRAAG
ncbi:MAG: hypothetical protein ACREIQ_11550 [Nitrospiria bacterium]